MYKNISFYDFVDSFSDTYKNNFTYDGKKALFEYLEEYEESTGEKIELDTVALCCEYTEYDTALEIATEYSKFTDDTTLTDEEREAAALEFLQDNTQVITYENKNGTTIKSGVIVQDF